MSRRTEILLLLLIVVGSSGLALHSMWANSLTVDEPEHFAAGMEWLDKGTYTYESIHPPLARVSLALGPYANGLRSTGREVMRSEGTAILYGDGNHRVNIFLMRLGMLPFLALAICCTFFFVRPALGSGAALLAAGTVASLPIVLAASSLAMTDGPLFAMYCLSFLSLVLWAEKPTILRALALGVSIGLGTLTKFSFIPYFGATALATAVVYGAINKQWSIGVGIGPAKLFKHAAFASALLLFVIWAGYRFETGALLDGSAPRDVIEGALVRIVGASGPVHDLTFAIANSSLFPAREFFLGIGSVAEETSVGRSAYLLGEVRQGGWWYFFPVAMAVKTPIPILLLACCGIYAAVAGFPLARNPRLIAALLSVLVVLAIAIPSRMQIGLRHVLPAYFGLAVLFAMGAALLWQAKRSRLLARTIVIGLGIWHVAAVATTSPNFISYFNETAAARKAHFLLMSDLDLGQDVYRLADRMESLGIERIHTRLFGNALLSRELPGEVHQLAPGQRPSGWIAVSALQRYASNRDELRWLDEHEPVQKAGESILLYKIP